jgi:hypothetical protein
MRPPLVLVGVAIDISDCYLLVICSFMCNAVHSKVKGKGFLCLMKHLPMKKYGVMGVQP